MSALPQEFFDEYPRCFPKRELFGRATRTPRCGAGCGEGWWPILHRLCAELANLDLPDGFAIEQIKEKFGGLRVYVSQYNDGIDAAIRAAESDAWRTCETCGEPGKLRNEGWAKVRCDKCQADWEASL